jgi:hypothetical protein
MRKKALPLLAIPLLAACTQPAPPAASASAAAGRQCFTAQQVSSFDAIDDDTVYVRTSPRRVYQLEIVGVCPDIDWSQRIALRSRTGSFICGGLDADLLVPRAGGGVDRCPVTNIRRLTDAEVQAWRGSRRRGS